jgi:citrate/tricarballylate utilization protein
MPAEQPFPDPRKTSLDLLVSEASRQLTICNSCRYCEGLCAVYPALERRNLFESGDVSQLANLCHDCRACYSACMYTDPHEFAVNIPVVLAEVRVHDYRRYVWPSREPRLLTGWLGVFSGSLIATLILLAAAVANAGFSGLVKGHSGAASPYDLIPYPALLALFLLPAIFSIVVLAAAGRRFWTETGATRYPLSSRAIRRAVRYASGLRYLRGGGNDCYYPSDEVPSATRRTLHGLVAYGFLVCVVSTVSAAIMQDLLGIQPPYPIDSVPVISGTIGGIGLVVGSAALLLLKTRSSRVTSVAEMTVKDYGLLVALTFLGLSGLATLLVRDTPAFGIVLLVHLAAVMLSLASAPYSKFSHLIYRFLALVRDNLEIEEQAAAKDTAHVGLPARGARPDAVDACAVGGRILYFGIPDDEGSTRARTMP